MFYVYIACYRIPHDQFLQSLWLKVNVISLSLPFLLSYRPVISFHCHGRVTHACSLAASSAIKARAKHVSSFNPLFWMLRLLPVRERPLRRKSRNCAHAARKRLRLNPANPTVGRTRRGLTTSSPTTRCPRFIFYEVHRIYCSLALRDGIYGFRYDAKLLALTRNGKLLYDFRF